MKQFRNFLFLGTGGSMGVPVIGCSCAVCRSTSPHNKRLRPSGLLTIADQKFLIDCGPDFRQQALTHKIDTLDGVILTHAHHDHTASLDELRIYYLRHNKALPCLLSKDTEADIKRRFYYMFKEDDPYAQMTTKLELHLLQGDRGKTLFQGVEISHFTYEQGGMQVNGFRIGSFAYVSDIRQFPETVYEDLKGVKILVLSALRHTPSHLHFNVDEAIEFSEKIGADHTWLTHIAHELDHEKTNAYLPTNIRLAYDGLQLNLE